MDTSSQPTAGQEQTAETEQSLECLDSLWRSSGHSPPSWCPRNHIDQSIVSPRPPQGTTDGAGTEAAQRTEALDVPSGSEEHQESETDNECLSPHLVDIFAGKDRPMSRDMEWCGWTTSSFEKFPAECRCIGLSASAREKKTAKVSRWKVCRSKSSTRCGGHRPHGSRSIAHPDQGQHSRTWPAASL